MEWLKTPRIDVYGHSSAISVLNFFVDGLSMVGVFETTAKPVYGNLFIDIGLLFLFFLRNFNCGFQKAHEKFDSNRHGNHVINRITERDDGFYYVQECNKLSRLFQRLDQYLPVKIRRLATETAELFEHTPGL